MKHIVPVLLALGFSVVAWGQPGRIGGGVSTGGPTNGITSSEGTNIAKAMAKLSTNDLHQSDLLQFYPSNNPAGFAPSNALGTAAFHVSTDFILTPLLGTAGRSNATDFVSYPTNSGSDNQVLSLTGDRTKWITPSVGGGGGDMLAANNLSDVANSGTARTNVAAHNASNLSAGTVADARLSANVALENVANVFTVSNSMTDLGVSGTQTVGTMVATNVYLNLANSTNLPGSGIQSGSINSNRLDAATAAQLALAGSGSGVTAAQLAAATNGQAISPSSVTNAALSASRMVISDANKKEISATASGSVPIDADGTATTAAQVNALGALQQVTDATNQLKGTVDTALALKAPLASPTFTGAAKFAASKYTTNALTLLVDFTVGNYSSIATNNNLTISGFTGIDAGTASTHWQVCAVSNSSASAITFSWPAACKIYGTNSGTSLSIPAGKVMQATFSVMPTGTNFVGVCQN